VCPGSATECQYSLQSFGIPAERIPMKTDSVMPKTEQHLKWLDFRQRKEDAIRFGTQFNEIEFPELKDVLLGRGQPLMRHPGYVCFCCTLCTSFLFSLHALGLLVCILLRPAKISWCFLRPTAIQCPLSATNQECCVQTHSPIQNGRIQQRGQQKGEDFYFS
jgi:hypothetical protein